MKKSLRFLVFIALLLFSVTPVFASTNTRERTDVNLLVPEKVEVNEAMKSAILSTPSVNAEEKIYDFADLFSDLEEEKLYNEVNEFIEKYNMDLAIVTISENNKYSEVEYADDFYDYNDFKTDGVLFLIDMDNRQIYMSTTGYAIKMYNDNRIDNTMDKIYRYATNKKYYECSSNFISIISSYAEKGLPGENKVRPMSTSTKFLLSLVISAVITTIIMLILVSKNKLVRKANEAKAYLVDDSVKIDVVSEILVNTHTTKRKIEHDSGGSSTHRGSSGITHGGGGHGF